MLTAVSARKCEALGLIIPGVKSFGQALKALRGTTKALDVAATALGERSTMKARRDFRNYLSRIENDRVPNVGLETLKLVGIGLGFTKLSDFLGRIEYLQGMTGEDKTFTLPEGKVSEHTTLLPQPEGASIGRTDSSVHDEIRSLREALADAGEILFNAGLGGARKLDADTRARKAGRGRARRHSAS